MTALIVNLVGLVCIVFVVWWFYCNRKDKSTHVSGSGRIKIVVKNGVYQPASVAAKVNQTIIFEFTRKDPSACASHVVFADFDQSAELPLNVATEIHIKPIKPGIYPFTCEMGMFRGQLVVSE